MFTIWSPEQLCHFAKSPSFLASAKSYTFTNHLQIIYIHFTSNFPKNRHFLGIFAGWRSEKNGMSSSPRSKTRRRLGNTPLTPWVSWFFEPRAGPLRANKSEPVAWPLIFIGISPTNHGYIMINGLWKMLQGKKTWSSWENPMETPGFSFSPTNQSIETWNIVGCMYLTSYNMMLRIFMVACNGKTKCITVYRWLYDHLWPILDTIYYQGVNIVSTCLVTSTFM